MDGSPSVTDWIQAISTGVSFLLTIPVLVYGGYKILFRDIEQEKKLDSLEKIAARQQDVVDKMQEQINDIKVQTMLMNESNDIAKMQLDVLSDLVKGQVELQKKKLEDKELAQIKHLNEIKPYFQFFGSMGGADGSIKVRLINRRGTAENMKVINDSTAVIALYPISDRVVVERGQELGIEGRILDVSQMIFTEASFRLVVHDIEGHVYSQTIYLRHRSFTVDNPVPFAD